MRRIGAALVALYALVAGIATTGALNPKDNTHSVTSRPATVNTGVDARKWFSDASRTVIYAQDLNNIIAQMRGCYDAYGVTDVEGSDTLLSDCIHAAVVAYAQPIDADLTALAALSSTGILSRTGSNTFAQRTLQAPAAGLTITNPAGVLGDPTFALANDLAALEALSCTNSCIPKRTGTDTWGTDTVGVDLEAWDADLDALAALSSTVGILKRTGAGAFGLAASGTDYAPATSGSAALLGNGSGGFSNYAGTSCTNQFPRSLSAAIAASCASVASTDVSFLDTDGALAADSDTEVATQKAVKTYVDGRYGENYILNPSFDVWQRGTTFSLASSTKTQVADLWFAYRNAIGSTISRAAGFSGSQYAIRLQRNSGNGSAAAIRVHFQLPTVLATALAGKTVIFCEDTKTGADYSGGLIGVTYHTSTGTDEPFDPSTGTFTSSTTTSADSSGAGTPTASAARLCRGLAYAVPAGTTEMVVRVSYTPSGTAGTNDYLDITNTKLEVGSVGTPFEPESPEKILLDGKRQYWKTFLYATAPAQNAGTGTGEFIFPAVTAGATTQRATVMFPEQMRAVPTGTIMNPSGTNAQCRDMTAGADVSASTITNITEHSAEITVTGAAGTAAGNAIGCHLTFDASP